MIYGERETNNQWRGYQLRMKIDIEGLGGRERKWEKKSDKITL